LKKEVEEEIGLENVADRSSHERSPPAERYGGEMSRRASRAAPSRSCRCWRRSRAVADLDRSGLAPGSTRQLGRCSLPARGRGPGRRRSRGRRGPGRRRSRGRRGPGRRRRRAQGEDEEMVGCSARGEDKDERVLGLKVYTVHFRSYSHANMHNVQVETAKLTSTHLRTMIAIG
jgi:hypothetical protein